MPNSNFEFLQSEFNITKETFEVLQTLSSKIELKTGEYIVEQGKKSNKVAILVSGLMRAHCTLESGKEITKNIFSPISFVGPLAAIIEDKPSLLSYEALVDSEVLEVNFQEFLKKAKTDVKISNFYNAILEYVFILYERKQLEMMSSNATQRYEELKKRIPNIEDLIPQYQIASYLNISPVQLSRIRKEIQGS